MNKSTRKSEIEMFAVNKAKALRESANMSQSVLAEELGVSDGFIGQVESTKFPSKYNFNHIDKLSRIFKCSPKDFLPDQPLNK